MEGYRPDSYGKGFADVYDDWYQGVSDVSTTVEAIAELAAGGPVLELGVGTGRLAVPLADRGLAVTGIDASDDMLAKLREHDPAGVVTTLCGDMVDNLPPGPFAVAFVAYNTFFNLLTAERQEACFAAIASRLVPAGRFVIEAFVPDDPPRDGSDVSVRSMTADQVVLSVSIHDADAQTAEGQFIELTESGGVRLRPWTIRYVTPEQLDLMATQAGFVLESRSGGFDRQDFGLDSERHVSVYRRAAI